MWTRLSRTLFRGADVRNQRAGHQYNAVTFQANRTYNSGLTYQFAYTLARDIGDLEGGQSPEDAFNRTRERAVWNRRGDTSN